MHNPIGLIGGIQKFSTEDGPGIRTTVFLKGCPLACQWCHNPELIDPGIQLMASPSKCIGCRACVTVCSQDAISFSPGPEGTGLKVDRERCNSCMKCVDVCYAKAMQAVGREMTVDQVMDEVRKDKGFYDNTGGGLTLSGGELLTQKEFALAMMEACQQEGIQVVLDTSGYGALEDLVELASRPNCTHVLYDLKLVDPDIHQQYTGVDNDLILANLRALAAHPELKKKLVIRIPLIQGVNDAEEAAQAAADLLASLELTRVELLTYHELGIPKARNVGIEPIKFSPPDEERLDQIRIQLRQ